MESLKDVTFVPPQRSAFLTVLCVLTFLGSCYQIITSVTTYFAADRVEEIAQRNFRNNEKRIVESKQKRRPIFLKDAEGMVEANKLRQNSMLMLVANLLTLVGGIFMFKMKPLGFWIYVVGTIVGVITPTLVFGDNTLIGFVTLVPAFVGLAFIVMYAFNLKDMKPQPLYD
jgi:hypothetical protein